MFIKLLKIITAILFIVLLSNCGQKKYTLDDITGIVKETDAKLHDLEGKNFEWASKSAFSNIEAYYPLPGYIFLNERFNFRSGGYSFNHYYFKDGNLVFYKQRKMTYIKIQGNRWRKAISSLDLYLDQNGTVVSFENVVDKKQEEIQGSQVADILARSKELYTLVDSEK